MRILLIEDDAVLGAAVRDQIAGDGQSVDWVTRLDAAGDALAREAQVADDLLDERRLARARKAGEPYDLHRSACFMKRNCRRCSA